MTSGVQCERDEDGRWLAKMPGAIAYGDTIEEAMAKAEALALQAAGEPIDMRRTGPSGEAAGGAIRGDKEPCLTPNSGARIAAKVAAKASCRERRFVRERPHLDSERPPNTTGVTSEKCPQRTPRF